MRPVRDYCSLFIKKRKITNTNQFNYQPYKNEIMTKDKLIRLNMYLTVANCVTQNEVAKRIPKFMETYATFQKMTLEIQTIVEKQWANKTGLARDKNKLKASLVNLPYSEDNIAELFFPLPTTLSSF
jgi:hypothetical protein